VEIYQLPTSVNTVDFQPFLLYILELALDNLCEPLQALDDEPMDRHSRSTAFI